MQYCGCVRNFVVGLVLGAAAVACAMFSYFRFGLAPVSTDAAPIPFENYLARTALHRRTRAAATDTSPINASEENLMAGARIYRSSCVACHALPGGGKTCFQKGMYP